MKTILEVLQATATYLTQHGVESARLNAEHVVAQALGKKRIDLYLEFDRPLSEAELAPMREVVRRRAEGVPLQHLLGSVEFHGRTFKCDARALIPRPETEHLVELVLKALPAPPGQLLDIGTGSGVIALTLAAELPEAVVHAVDISDDALDLARENAQQLGLSDRVRFWRSDLFEMVTDRYSLIVANLPYIATGTIPTLEREVQHDPVQALDGGPAGHELIARLIAASPAHIIPGGMIALETGGAGQAEALTPTLESAGFSQIRCASDLQGVNRFLFAVYG